MSRILFTSFDVPAAASPAFANTTTAQAIRDRMIAVIEGITPRSLAGDRFRRYRNEGAGKFRPWALAFPGSARRRFQVRQIGDREEPSVSNGDFEERVVSFLVLVAYPQTHRDGPDAALDRDDAIDDDTLDIDYAIGANGRGNFAPPYPDACWHPEGNGESSRIAEIDEDQPGVDFAQIYVSYAYRRARIA